MKVGKLRLSGNLVSKVYHNFVANGHQKKFISQSKKELDFSALLCQSEHIEANLKRSIWSSSPLGTENGTDSTSHFFDNWPSHRKINNNLKKDNLFFKNLKKKDVEYIATSNLLLQCKLKLFIWIYEVGYSNGTFSKPLLST